MNTWGGFGQYISVPRHWALPLPDGLPFRETMAFGTAGLTAGLSVEELIKGGILSGAGKISVSGATGVVVSLAAMILKKFGTVAISGKANDPFLTDLLGFDEFEREAFVAQFDQKTIGPTEFAGAIDTVSGKVLSGILKSASRGGVVTCCGMVGSADLQTSIFPFILRGVRLVGIDSVEIPLARKKEVWQRLASDWKPENLGALYQEIILEELCDVLEAVLKGQAKGRFVLCHHEPGQRVSGQ